MTYLNLLVAFLALYQPCLFDVAKVINPSLSATSPRFLCPFVPSKILRKMHLQKCSRWTSFCGGHGGVLEISDVPVHSAEQLRIFGSYSTNLDFLFYTNQPQITELRTICQSLPIVAPSFKTICVS